MKPLVLDFPQRSRTRSDLRSVLVGTKPTYLAGPLNHYSSMHMPSTGTFLAWLTSFLEILSLLFAGSVILDLRAMNAICVIGCLLTPHLVAMRKHFELQSSRFQVQSIICLGLGSGSDIIKLAVAKV